MTADGKIVTEYEPEIGGFLVSMPTHITLRAIKTWEVELLQALEVIPEQRRCCLLVDSNLHEFESIACLKAMREVLEGTPVASKCARVAFVQPRHVREPHVASDREAYFDGKAAAYAWLNGGVE